MSIGTAAAIGIGIAGVAGGVASAAIGANAAGNAADSQVSAANRAADLQKQAADNSLAFQKQEWQTQQSNIAPWLNAGKGGLSSLSQFLGIGKDNGTGGYGSLLQPYGPQFTAPTGLTEQNDPGYQARMALGTQALDNSAAARGGLLSSGAAKQQQEFGQTFGSNEYGNVYGRSMQQYQLGYNQYQQANADKYNRLAALSGSGQVAAQTLGQQGQAAANNISNTLLTSGGQIGQDYLAAGNARASGYINQANAWSGGISGSTNSFLQSLLMGQYLGGNQYQGPGGPNDPQAAANALGIGNGPPVMLGNH